MSDDPTPEVPVEGEPPAPPAPVSRPRWKRRVAVVLAPLLVLGLAGAGVAVAVDQHDAKVRRDRAAAERRAVAAYVASVRPLALRVYDAVQPIQDAMDAWAHLRPGLWEAGRDVVLKSGARAELVAVRQALLEKTPPPSQVLAADDLAAAAKELATAVKGMEDSVRAAEKSTLCTLCLAQDALGVAETGWTDALEKLGVAKISAPSVNDAGKRGRSAPTRGGFIFGSDLACSAGDEKFVLLPDRKGAEQVKNLPALSKIFLSTVASLRKVKTPTTSAAVGHRLDIELQSVTAFADTMNQLYAAYRQHSLQKYKAALVQWKLELKAMDTLASTYTSLGVTQCAEFFDTSDAKTASKSLSA